MKYCYLLLTLFFLSSTTAQNKSNETFEEVKQQISKTLFRDPEGTKPISFKLKRLAKTNKEIAIAYQGLGYIYDLTGNSDSARYYLSRRLEITKEYFPKEGEYYQAVIDFVNWGTDFVEDDLLVKELTDALEIIDENEFKRKKGLMLLLLGDVFLMDKEIDKAEYYFDTAITMISGRYAQLDYYFRKGQIEVIRKNYDKANEYMLKAFSFANDKEVHAYPQVVKELGHIALLKKDYSKAKQYLNESLHYQNENGFNSLSSGTYLDLYFLEKHSKKDGLMEKYYLDKALEFNDGELDLLKDIYLAFKDYYSRNNNLEKEIEFNEKYNKVNDSLFNKEKLKVKSDLESRYQLSESKKELAHKEKIIQKDKSIKEAYLLGLSLLGVLILVILIFYFLRLKTQKKLRYNQKLLHEEQLKLMLENQRTEIIKEKIKAKVEERGKLSLELHDGIASEISALKLSLATESKLSKLEIDELVEKIDKVYTEIRNLSHDLDPDNIDFIEFSQFVENLCVQIEKSGLQTIKNLYITKRIDDLEVETLVNIYRIIQEIITNVLKHANATQVVFDVIETDDVLYIHIKDNGTGFDLYETQKGIGLRNIQKRIDSFNGNFEIITKKGEGTEFKINLPIKL